jgi:hypothetical protein
MEDHGESAAWAERKHWPGLDADPGGEPEVERLDDPTRRKLEQAQALRGELQGSTLDSVRTLRELMTAVDAPAAVRIRAALAVLHAVGADAPGANGPVNPADVGERWGTRGLLRAIHGVP